MIPNVVSWTHELHDACVLCLWNLDEFIAFRIRFLKAKAILCVFLARPCRLHLNFQFSLDVLNGFFLFSIFRIDITNAS